ncbi:hypothetical protein GQ600_8685 [Phytophthora cactorum]|nr:hypothetical protein GQ600_8685 [Phytophthora cactorum]
MPISTPVLPLRVSSTSHAPLVKWRRERRKYEETIPNRTKGDTDNKIVPVKTTFDEGLLRMRCRLLWRLSIGNVTDEQILTEIDKIIASAKNNSVRDGDREMREMLRMDLFVRYLCRVLIASLVAQGLREEVERTICFQARTAMSDEVALHDLVLEKALNQEKSLPKPKTRQARSQ